MSFKNSVSAALAIIVFSIGSSLSAGNEASGLRTTPNGVPWYVADRPSNYSSAEAALRIASTKWRSPWAMKIKSDTASGMFRLVTVNGSTYVVLGRIRGPFTLNQSKQKQVKVGLFHAAAKQAGCTSQGSILAKYSPYREIEKLAVQVRCSFI